MITIKVASLFAGCGGFDLGFILQLKRIEAILNEKNNIPSGEVSDV